VLLENVPHIQRVWRGYCGRQLMKQHRATFVIQRCFHIAMARSKVRILRFLAAEASAKVFLNHYISPISSLCTCCTFPSYRL
jgi:hypothetical protein